MSSEQRFARGYKADGATTPLPIHRAVIFSSTEGYVELPGGANEKVAGVLENTVDRDGMNCSVTYAGETWIEAGGTVSMGDEICADGDGKGIAAAASYTTNLTGATNNDLVWTSLVGDGVTLEYFDPGGTTATLTIFTFGKHIRVSLGRDSSAIDTTGDLLKAAIAAHPAAAALVSVENAAANDGSGLVAALSTVSLTGAGNAFAVATMDAAAGDLLHITMKGGI